MDCQIDAFPDSNYIFERVVFLLYQSIVFNILCVQLYVNLSVPMMGRVSNLTYATARNLTLVIVVWKTNMVS